MGENFYQPRRSPRISRRSLLLGGLGIGATAIVGGVLYRDLEGLFSTSAETKPAAAPDVSQPQETDPLTEIAQRIVSGGPPKDGIPAIDEPKYILRQEADATWLDDDIVDGITLGGTPKAFPRGINVWHEIVNEMAEGRNISITYCPLTGSSIGFFGSEQPSGREGTFGTSGKLYNSNLVMYDRSTDSYWPQLLGQGVSGPRKGEVLEEFSVVTTTWGRWKRKHPDTLVLSTDTGHLRSYGVSPYGDYDSNETVLFPVTNDDERFHPKKVFIVAKLNGEQLAVGREEFAARKVAEETLGGEPLVVLYDDELDFIRFFSRRTESEELSFKLAEGRVADVGTGSTWDALGRAASGPLAGTELKQINGFAVQWFAWAAFYPQTRVLV